MRKLTGLIEAIGDNWPGLFYIILIAGVVVCMIIEALKK